MFIGKIRMRLRAFYQKLYRLILKLMYNIYCRKAFIMALYVLIYGREEPLSIYQVSPNLPRITLINLQLNQFTQLKEIGLLFNHSEKGVSEALDIPLEVQKVRHQTKKILK